MNYKGYMKTQEQFEILKNILKKFCDKKEAKQENPCYINVKGSKLYVNRIVLYIISNNGNHKLVVSSADVVTQKQLAMQVYSGAHVVMNKTVEMCNQLYFTIPKTVIRDVIASCYVCSKAQPLKTKDKILHIRAVACNERWQID